MKRKYKIKRPITVKFENMELENVFNVLEETNNRLYKDIDRARRMLKQKSTRGSFVKNYKKKKEFKRFWHYSNLWKYDINKRDRLIYTREVNRLTIVCIILEWGPHDDYKNLMIFFPYIQFHYVLAHNRYYRRR